MGCVNNVYEHQQYLISCFERILCELRAYHLKKSERELLNRCLMDFYVVCKDYRDRRAAIQQKKIDELIVKMSKSRSYDCEDDLPF